MQIKTDDIERIVKEVLEKMKPENAENPSFSSPEEGIFETMEEAIEKAKAAQREIAAMPLEKRSRIVQEIRSRTKEAAEQLAIAAVEETGMGRIDHKIQKHLLLADKAPGTEVLKTQAWSGDGGLTLVEMGPFGVVGAITPSTNPSETVICNTMALMAAGNSVVFNPHPNAKRVSQAAIKLVNQASQAVGGPKLLATTVKEPSLASSDVLMKHQDVSLLVVTGGPGVVTAALSSGKRAIGAGAGNPPVVVDETADIQKAAKDILDGATFDNNLPCIAEKEVVAVKSIYENLIEAMRCEGAYLLSDAQVNTLVELVLVNRNGHYSVHRDWVGKDPAKFLEALGVDSDPYTRCLIFKAEPNHIFVQEELMMPILGIVAANDVDEAIELAVQMEHGNRHSAHMHSKNIDHLTKFAKKIDTAIFVKNAPSYAALGLGGEGYCTFTIASRTGEGLTSAESFTKSRRCVLSDGLSIR